MLFRSGLINHGHATTTKLLHKAVVRDGLADHSGNTRPGILVASSERCSIGESTNDGSRARRKPEDLFVWLSVEVKRHEGDHRNFP